VKKGRSVRLVKLYSPDSTGLDKWTAQQWKQQYVSYIFMFVHKGYAFFEWRGMSNDLCN